MAGASDDCSTNESGPNGWQRNDDPHVSIDGDSSNLDPNDRLLSISSILGQCNFGGLNSSTRRAGRGNEKWKRLQNIEDVVSSLKSRKLGREKRFPRATSAVSATGDCTAKPSSSQELPVSVHCEQSGKTKLPANGPSSVGARDVAPIDTPSAPLPLVGHTRDLPPSVPCEQSSRTKLLISGSSSVGDQSIEAPFGTPSTVPPIVEPDGLSREFSNLGDAQNPQIVSVCSLTDRNITSQSLGKLVHQVKRQIRETAACVNLLPRTDAQAGGGDKNQPAIMVGNVKDPESDSGCGTHSPAPGSECPEKIPGTRHENLGTDSICTDSLPRQRDPRDSLQSVSVSKSVERPVGHAQFPGIVASQTCIGSQKKLPGQTVNTGQKSSKSSQTQPIIVSHSVSSDCRVDGGQHQDSRMRKLQANVMQSSSAQQSQSKRVGDPLPSGKQAHVQSIGIPVVRAQSGHRPAFVAQSHFVIASNTQIHVQPRIITPTFHLPQEVSISGQKGMHVLTENPRMAQIQPRFKCLHPSCSKTFLTNTCLNLHLSEFPNHQMKLVPAATCSSSQAEACQMFLPRNLHPLERQNRLQELFEKHVSFQEISHIVLPSIAKQGTVPGGPGATKTDISKCAELWDFMVKMRQPATRTTGAECQAAEIAAMIEAFGCFRKKFENTLTKLVKPLMKEEEQGNGSLTRDSGVRETEIAESNSKVSSPVQTPREMNNAHMTASNNDERDELPLHSLSLPFRLVDGKFRRRSASRQKVQEGFHEFTKKYPREASRELLSEMTDGKSFFHEHLMPICYQQNYDSFEEFSRKLAASLSLPPEDSSPLWGEIGVKLEQLLGINVLSPLSELRTGSKQTSAKKGTVGREKVTVGSQTPDAEEQRKASGSGSEKKQCAEAARKKEVQQQEVESEENKTLEKDGVEGHDMEIECPSGEDFLVPDVREQMEVNSATYGAGKQQGHMATPNAPSTSSTATNVPPECDLEKTAAVLPGTVSKPVITSMTADSSPRSVATGSTTKSVGASVTKEQFSGSCVTDSPKSVTTASSSVSIGASVRIEQFSGPSVTSSATSVTTGSATKSVGANVTSQNEQFTDPSVTDGCTAKSDGASVTTENVTTGSTTKSVGASVTSQNEQFTDPSVTDGSSLASVTTGSTTKLDCASVTTENEQFSGPSVTGESSLASVTTGSTTKLDGASVTTENEQFTGPSVTDESSPMSVTIGSSTKTVGASGMTEITGPSVTDGSAPMSMTTESPTKSVGASVTTECASDFVNVTSSPGSVASNKIPKHATKSTSVTPQSTSQCVTSGNDKPGVTSGSSVSTGLPDAHVTIAANAVKKPNSGSVVAARRRISNVVRFGVTINPRTGLLKFGPVTRRRPLSATKNTSLTLPNKKLESVTKPVGECVTREGAPVSASVTYGRGEGELGSNNWQPSSVGPLATDANNTPPFARPVAAEAATSTSLALGADPPKTSGNNSRDQASTDLPRGTAAQQTLYLLPINKVPLPLRDSLGVGTDPSTGAKGEIVSALDNTGGNRENVAVLLRKRTGKDTETIQVLSLPQPSTHSVQAQPQVPIAERTTQECIAAQTGSEATTNMTTKRATGAQVDRPVASSKNAFGGASSSGKSARGKRNNYQKNSAPSKVERKSVEGNVVINWPVAIRGSNMQRKVVARRKLLVPCRSQAKRRALAPETAQNSIVEDSVACSVPIASPDEPLQALCGDLTEQSSLDSGGTSTPVVKPDPELLLSGQTSGTVQGSAAGSLASPPTAQILTSSPSTVAFESPTLVSRQTSVRSEANPMPVSPLTAQLQTPGSSTISHSATVTVPSQARNKSAASSVSCTVASSPTAQRPVSSLGTDFQIHTSLAADPTAERPAMTSAEDTEAETLANQRESAALSRADSLDHAASDVAASSHPLRDVSLGDISGAVNNPGKTALGVASTALSASSSDRAPRRVRTLEPRVALIACAVDKPPVPGDRSVPSSAERSGETSSGQSCDVFDIATALINTLTVVKTEPVDTYETSPNSSAGTEHGAVSTGDHVTVFPSDRSTDTTSSGYTSGSAIWHVKQERTPTSPKSSRKRRHECTVGLRSKTRIVHVPDEAVPLTSQHLPPSRRGPGNATSKKVKKEKN